MSRITDMSLYTLGFVMNAKPSKLGHGLSLTVCTFVSIKRLYSSAFDNKNGKIVVSSIQTFVLHLMFLSGAIVPAVADEAHSGETPWEGPLSLIVNVQGLKCCDGVLRIALYPEGSDWLEASGMARGRISMIDSDTQQIEIHGLPEGTYALAVHQDLNNDGKLNRRFGLIPREPYGFSNDVGKYGPASFKQASFHLARDMNITVSLHGSGKR